MPPDDPDDHGDPRAFPYTLRVPGTGGDTLRVVPRAPATPADRIDMPVDDPRRYDIYGTLGEGGLGKTLEVYDRRLGRTIALKQLLHYHPDDRERFVREALITARLEHPAIVPVYDVGHWPSGEPFYVMKRVLGRSLREVMYHTHTLDDRLALLPHLLAVADAMAYAHSHHVIHRDLKPSNVLIGPFGETVVIDWGLAKDLRRGDEPAAAAPIPEPLADDHLTQAGLVMGTPAYMPPEQAAARPVDERADVYALGVILYELLSGRPPYAEESDSSAQSVLTQILASPPPPVEQLQPGIPPDLVALVKKAMARDPAGRYPSAREFAEDLRNFQTGRLVSAHQYSRPALARRWLRRHRLPVLITGLFLIALSGGGLLSVRRILAARRLAEHRAAELLLSQARGALERDPTEALAWLRTYLDESPAPDEPDDLDELRALAIEAQSRGVARHVLPQAGFHGFTADGRAWIEARDGQHIDLRDLTSGALLHRVTAPEGIHKIAISPDRRRLAVLSQQQHAILLHDLAQGRTERLPLGSARVHELCFSPDGKALATGDHHGAVHLWLLSSPGSAPRLVGRHPSGVLYLSFSRDGRWLISSSEEPLTARLWEVDGPGHHEVHGPPRTRSVAELSPDASLFAIGAPDGTLTLVDLRQGTRRVLGHHPALLHDLHFSPDGTHLVTAGEDGLIELWTLSPGEPRRLTPRHASAALRVNFTPDGRRILSASYDGEVRLWERETGAYQTLGRVLGRVTGIELAPGGRHVAVTTLNKSARLWELPPGRGRTLPGHTDDVYQVLYSSDGHTLVSTSRDLSLHWWRLPAGPDGALRGHRDTAPRIALLPGGESVVAASYDQTVRQWDLHPCLSGTADASTCAAGRIVIEHPSPTRSVAASPDGQTLASGNADGEIRLWHRATGAVRVLRGPRGVIRALAFSPDGQRLVSGDERGELWHWTLATPAGHEQGHGQGQGRLLPGTGRTIENLAYARDGRLLASADRDGAVRLWQTETGALRVLGHHEGAVRDVAFAPDGQHLASAGEDGTVQLFDLPGGTAHLLGRHHERVYKLAFAPDGSILASASQDHSVRLWHMATRSLLQILWHEHEATYVTFAPDGQTLAVAGTGGTVRLWPLDQTTMDQTTMDRTTMDRSTPPTAPAALRSWLLGLSTATLGPRQRLATPPAN